MKTYKLTLTEKEIEDIRNAIDFKYQQFEYDAGEIEDNDEYEERKTLLQKLDALDKKILHQYSPLPKIYHRGDDLTSRIFKAINKKSK